MKNAIAALVLANFGWALATAAIAQVSGRIFTYIVPPALVGARIDYANAKPMPTPVAPVSPVPLSEAIRTAPDPLMLFGNPQSSPGSVGSGQEDPVQLAPPQRLQQESDAIPYEFGSADLPFTTSRVNAEGDYTAKYSPFRAAGKLFITRGFTESTCSAAMINRGLAVTAAHCVVKYNTNQHFTTAEFVPGYDNGTAPYGKGEVASAVVLQAYRDGTDHCNKDASVCPDDIAVLTLRRMLGDSTGWFGVGYDGYGFTPSGQALIDQLGYPGDLDSGKLMERNDSQGFISASAEESNNTIIGSLMTQGSSGGPFLVNLGVTPAVSPFLPLGRDAAPDVVGVTSWVSSIDNYTPKRMGASPFRVTNIRALIIEACHATPTACK